MNNSDILSNIIKMQESSAENYFESRERFFLINILKKIRNNSDIQLTNNEIAFIEKIFKKYLKFID